MLDNISPEVELENDETINMLIGNVRSQQAICVRALQTPMSEDKLAGHLAANDIMLQAISYYDALISGTVGRKREEEPEESEEESESEEEKDMTRWLGYYTQDGTIHHMDVLLKFKHSALKGHGEDAMGSFQVDGFYTRADGQVKFTKQYSTYDVKCTGVVDVRAEFRIMHGEWEIKGLTHTISGDFKLTEFLSEDAAQQASAAEEEAKVAEDSARKLGARLKAAEEEVRASQAELTAQEYSFSWKQAELTRASEQGGIVSRNKAKNELFNIMEEHLPLRRAQIRITDAVNKAEAARDMFKAATDKAAGAILKATAARKDAVARREEAAEAEQAAEAAEEIELWRQAVGDSLEESTESVEQSYTCPTGHALVVINAHHSRSRCDICGCSQALGERTFGCRICNWGSCEFCLTKKVEYYESEEKCDMPEVDMPAGHTFGVEFELTFPSDVKLDILIQLLDEAHGIKCKIIKSWREGKKQKQFWKFVPDSSIKTSGDYTQKQELVSPILHGSDGIEEMNNVLDIICMFRPKVNPSTAFHVHVGLQRVSTRNLKRLCQQYMKFETAIDLLNPTRLNSRFAKSNRKNYHVSDAALARSLARCETEKEICDFMNPDFNRAKRYYKMNLQCLDTKHTVEFRQHAGTYDKTVAENWVKFCLAFVQNSFGYSVVKPLSSDLKPYEKLTTLLEDVIADDDVRMYYLPKILYRFGDIYI